MKENVILKIFTNMIVILFAMYFIPFLGVCLLILNYFIQKKHRLRNGIILTTIGILIFLPKGIGFNQEWYTIDLLNYGKTLITSGVLFLIISALGHYLGLKAADKVKEFIQKEQQKDIEIRAKNDLIMQEKREKAKNTTYIKCPYCGSDNIISEKIGVCSYCRRKITKENN